MERFSIYVFVFALITISSRILGAIPGVIPEHGKYSEAYLKEWSDLPNGKLLAQKKMNNLRWVETPGESARRVVENQPSVVIRDQALKIRWNFGSDKTSTTLFTVRNCETVLIENVWIVQENTNEAAYHSIAVEDCGEVMIRNCYFAGPASSAHIRIEGCADLLIDSVEISGIQGRCGSGIFVNNGSSTQKEGPHGNLIFSANPREPRWLTIQNCYIHDLTNADKWANKDGILIHSSPDGLLFNCYLENWDMRYADGAMDLSHRRTDLTNRVLRVERNIVKNCSLTKSPGFGSPDDAIVWANNLFINSFHGDYHSVWQNVFVHNTWIYDDPRANTHYKLWGFGGTAAVRNCLVVASHPMAMVYQNNELSLDKYKSYFSDNNIYVLDEPAFWLTGARGEKMTFSQWREAGSDKQSVVIENFPGKTILLSGDGYRVPLESKITGSVSSEIFFSTNDIRFRVSRDYFGKARSPRPTAGAVQQ